MSTQKYWLAAAPIALLSAPASAARQFTMEDVFQLTYASDPLVDSKGTPISETEQYYQALKLRGVETAMVRMPGASHSIYKRPSQLIGKVAEILEWFGRYKDPAGWIACRFPAFVHPSSQFAARRVSLLALK